MTAEQKIARITKIIKEYNVREVTKDEFYSNIDKQRLIDIKDEMWELYCLISNVVNTINM